MGEVMSARLVCKNTCAAAVPPHWDTGLHAITATCHRPMPCPIHPAPGKPSPCVADLTYALSECLNSLEYLHALHPDDPAFALRADRIRLARVALGLESS